MKLHPISLKDANLFVGEIHRHNNPVQGHKFSLSIRDETGTRGVAIVGRPLARMLDDGLTLEVLRVATDGIQNGCSKLYGASKRAAAALGYDLLITYTLEKESGSSLKGAGFQSVVTNDGSESWNRPSRKRPTQLRLDGRPIRPLDNKTRWECVLG